jgi:antitoxin MazE
MKVKVAKWGNSLGVRLPKIAAEAIGAAPGREVDVVVERGEVRLKPLRTSLRYRFEDLIAEMKGLGPEAEPESVDWGPDVGAEIIDDAYSRGEITLDDILKRKRRSGRRKSTHASRRRRHRMG